MNDPLLAQIQKQEGDDSDGEVNPIEKPTNDSFPGRRQMGPQTGPKGVLADHAHYQQEQRGAQADTRRAYNAKMLAKAPTTTTYLQDEAERQLILEHPTDNKQDSDDDDLLDEEDEEAIRQYREKRLAELKGINNHQSRMMHRVFGKLEDIAADDYATVIDKEWRTVPVIVHLYDESIPTCRKLDDYLMDLAQKYALAKFIRVSAMDLEFDLVGSPAILGYKGGMLVANLVRFVDYVGPRFSEDAVEAVLLRSKALGEDDRYHGPVNEENE
ncbi:thioredoxin-like protein [Phascolomyces articulosus]|uniref:Thioredoxin-like protein n=1 Tax=Phascolomyces articulosus TaxID=60185 RepID=A0AAD5KQY4_9FUNG|nr:thioredoxin-like protein [Phascolomyces articulosus]